MLKDQADYLDRDRVAELLVADVTLGMEFEAFGEGHDPATFLWMKTTGFPIHEVHAGLGTHATPESGQGNGVSLDAVDALTLTALAHGTDPKRPQFAGNR